MGVRLIQIFESEYLSNKNFILKKLLYIVGGNNGKHRVFARNCKVDVIDNQIAKDFLDKHHIQGFAASSIYIGLYNDDILLSVMSFKKENKLSFNYELTRFATHNDYVVCGAAGKLLSFFKKMFSPHTIYRT